MKMNDVIHKRMIHEDFVNELQCGILSDIIDLVNGYQDDQGQPVLYMAFRGSYINIYFHSHVVFHISRKDNGNRYRISFDFNHARFSPEYKEDLKTLQEYGWRLPAGRTEIIKNDAIKGTKSSGNNQISLDICRKETQTSDYLRESCQILLRLMRDFFDVSKTRDYFTIPEKEICVNYAEKDRQQKIAMANRFCRSGLYIYDIEYRDPEKCQTKGRYDMLAVQIDSDGVARSLLFLELKTNGKSCEGASGVDDHRCDMKEYLARKDLIDQRIQDCRNIFAAYHRLGILEDEIRFGDELCVCSYFLFTDTARDYLKKHQNDCADGISLDAPWVIDPGLISVMRSAR